MWSDLLSMNMSSVEKVLRTVGVYGGLAILLRLGGKREMAQLNTFDLVVMLLLSNVVQNAVIGNDNSLTGGLLGAAVLVALNAVVVRLANRHPRLTKVFEGTETTLITDGKLVANLPKLGMRKSNVVTALRRQGADTISEVQSAVLSPGGSIMVTLKPEDRDVTTAQLAEMIGELERRMDAGFAAVSGNR
jgi:uncharacterized membrane protein YcaP (DUF421 family)